MKNQENYTERKEGGAKSYTLSMSGIVMALLLVLLLLLLDSLREWTSPEVERGVALSPIELVAFSLFRYGCELSLEPYVLSNVVVVAIVLFVLSLLEKLFMLEPEVGVLGTPPLLERTRIEVLFWRLSDFCMDTFGIVIGVGILVHFS